MSQESAENEKREHPSLFEKQNVPFLQACRREACDYTPIWLMRQAGRYQASYRQFREHFSFLDMCKRPDLSAQVTVDAVEQIGVDAAIIFADILLICEPMGVELTFNEGEGPRITPPLRSGADIDALKEVEPADSLDFVFEAIRVARMELAPTVPLIGFCGAPFTVASYMIEGKTSRDFVRAKTAMYADSGAWHALMEKLVVASAKYLNGQIQAGAQAVQVFDSWVGYLDEADYRRFVLPHSKALIDAIEPSVPVIHFGANTAALLGAMREAGGHVIGMDWRVNLAKAWADLGYDVAVQGNLDPVVLFTSPEEIQTRAHAILDQVGGRPGHIFNLGHGVLPRTPIENVIALVEAVHEYKSEK